MVNSKIQHAQEQARKRCRLLLSHTISCGACFNVSAYDGRLGRGCPTGRSLQVDWVITVEALRSAEYDAAASACTNCGD